MLQPSGPRGLATSEQLIGALLAGAVCAMVLGALAPVLGLAIRPWPIALVSVTAASGAALWLGRFRAPAGDDVRSVTTAALLVMAAFAGYVLWLAWPSLYPATSGPDLVHHLSLVHFIQQRGTLPSSLFGAYLGEMTSYPPGSHVLAAVTSGVFDRDAMAVIHPLMAVAVALKAGLVFHVIVRILPAAPSRVPVAVTGALLLLSPHAYLLSPVTVYGFYSQVLAEVGAVAIVWMATVWHHHPTRSWLALASLLGIGIVLTWPVFLPVPASVLALVIGWRQTRPIGSRVQDLILALGPPAVVSGAFVAAQAGSAGILASGGSVLTPAVALFGWPFLVLTTVGAAVMVRQASAFVPILAFVVLCLLQVAGLIVLQHLLGATNYYLGFKTVHLLVYALVVLAGVGVATTWARLTMAAPPKWRAAVERSTWLVPVVVLVLLLRSDMPQSPLRSPLTEPVYQAGRWARAHVPPACIDYLVPDWVTAYWLHLDVLGNARASTRVDNDPYDFRRAISAWVGSGSMRFAIVADWTDVPADARDRMRVLATFGPALVVERTDEGGTCIDETPPIDQVDR